MSIWHIILLAWMAYQLFTVFRAYFLAIRETDKTPAAIVALIIGAGLWALLFTAMLHCGLLDGINLGRIRIG